MASTTEDMGAERLRKIRSQTKADEKTERFAEIALVFLLLPAAVMRGWVISIIWGWFVAPLGLPQIGIAHAIGLSLTLVVLAQNIPYESPKVWARLGRVIVGPPLTLGTAAVVHWFM